VATVAGRSAFVTGAYGLLGGWLMRSLLERIMAEYQVDTVFHLAAQSIDSTKLRELSGWEPRVSLRDGLRDTVDWYRRHRQRLG
jgi:nucleoside-diphosphate-sugar epimerase